MTISDIAPVGPNITGAAAGRAGTVQDAAQRAYGASVERSSKHDRVEVSEFGRLLAQVQSDVANAPDTRQELIEATRAQIEQGSYRIDAQLIAERMASGMGLGE